MRDIIGEMRWGMMGGGYAGRYWRDEVGYDGRGGICGTDHLPEIGPAGLPFLAPSPQSTKGGKWERKITSDPKKRMLIFNLNC